MPPAYVLPAACSFVALALVLVAVLAVLILVVVLVLIILVLIAVLVPVLVVVLVAAHGRETSFPKTVRPYCFPDFPALYMGVYE